MVLLEAAIANVILATAIVAIVPIFIFSLRSIIVSQDNLVGAQLAMELMEEIRVRRFGENISTIRPGIATASLSGLGRDAGESATDKTTFDDVDDFQSWSESPPRDPLNNPLTQFSGWKRTVSVTFYDSNVNPSGAAQSRKRVDVMVYHNGILRSSVSWMSANW